MLNIEYCKELGKKFQQEKLRTPTREGKAIYDANLATLAIVVEQLEGTWSELAIEENRNHNGYHLVDEYS